MIWDFDDFILEELQKEASTDEATVAAEFSDARKML